jgi:hypothetical protein
MQRLPKRRSRRSAKSRSEMHLRTSVLAPVRRTPSKCVVGPPDCPQNCPQFVRFAKLTGPVRQSGQRLRLGRRLRWRTWVMPNDNRAGHSNGQSLSRRPAQGALRLAAVSVDNTRHAGSHDGH